ncbi:MAG: ABC transporter permease subunit [Anaerolineales bacterium]|jgi:general L-amino acid transport system permease protein
MTQDQQNLPSKLFRRDIPVWRDERVLRVLAQIISAIVIIGFFFWMVNNVVTAANQRGLSLGFRFLDDAAGFPIGESPIPYDPSNTFAYAFYVGLLNTVKVSVIGVILATILGIIVGLARLSTNWLVNRLALTFIEIHRNIPLLVLLFLWYQAVFLKLPGVRQSIVWPGPVYLNQRGLYMTWPRFTESATPFIISIISGIILATAVYLYLRKRRETSGKPTYYGAAGLAILIAFPILGWFLADGVPLRLDVPELSGFNFRGGAYMTPEFAALLIGLFTYTAAFIAEVVRAGIQAVNRGQLEAARAVGLDYVQVLSLIIMPQALRVIIPPLISQYLNLIKNSSLAFFIGFPDLFYIGRTTINQAGRAIPVFLLIMTIYLGLSLITSIFMNYYNKRIQLVER